MSSTCRCSRRSRCCRAASASRWRCARCARGRMAPFNLWWAVTIALGALLPRGDRHRVGRLDLRPQPDDLDQPLRHDLLLAGRLPRRPRHRRPPAARAGAVFSAARRGARGARRARRDPVLVLALRRRVWVVVFTVVYVVGTMSEPTRPSDADRLHRAAGADGVADGRGARHHARLRRAGDQPLVTMVGVVLTIAGAVGWFRDVLPVEHVERVPLRAAGAARPAGRSRSRRAGGASRARRRGHRVRIAGRDPSVFRRHLRRPRRRRRDGGAGGALRRHRVRQPLVSDQSARGGGDAVAGAAPTPRSSRRSTALALGVAAIATSPSRSSSAWSTPRCCRCSRAAPALWGGVIAPLLWTACSGRRSA